jgi:hypothetical protein
MSEVDTELNRAREVFSFLDPPDIRYISSLTILPKVVEKFPPYTVLTRDFFLAVFDEAKEIHKMVAQEGEWVQVGVWKGGGALFFRALMEDWQLTSNLYLFDTFDGCRASTLSHPEDKVFTETLNLKDMTASYEDAAESLLERFGLRSNVFFCKGDIRDQNEFDVPEKISFLHLDVDFYEPTYSALNIFYDRVIENGVILIDDYYLDLVNCKQAVDSFIYERKLNDKIEIRKFSSFSVMIKKLRL